MLRTDKGWLFWKYPSLEINEELTLLDKEGFEDTKLQTSPSCDVAIDALQIATNDGLYIPVHPRTMMWVVRHSEVRWVMAEDLNYNDLLLYRYAYNEDDRILATGYPGSVIITFTPEMSYIFGVLFQKVNFNTEELSFSFFEEERELLLKVKDYLEQTFDVYPDVAKTASGYTLSIQDSTFEDWLVSYNLHPKQCKELSALVANSGKEYIKEFLRGFLMQDLEGELKCMHISRRFLTQLAVALRSVGHRVKIRTSGKIVSSASRNPRLIYALTFRSLAKMPMTTKKHMHNPVKALQDIGIDYLENIHWDVVLRAYYHKTRTEGYKIPFTKSLQLYGLPIQGHTDHVIYIS